MSIISSVTVSGSQTNPTVTITGSGFGTTPATAATPAGSGMTGFNYGTSLYITDGTQNFSAGLFTPATNNSIGLTNLTYSDSAISFQLGSAYSLFLYNLKQGDGLGVSVNGALLNTTVNYNPPLTQVTIGVARFFDTTYGTHFFTSSGAEVQQILKTRPDLVEESNGFNAIDPSSNDANALPVYRFFDSIYGTHFFTSSAAEANTVLATRPDLKPEGIAFSEDATQQGSDVPVYRFFDTQHGTHFYSASASEIASIQASRPDLKAEGIAFYAPT